MLNPSSFSSNPDSGSAHSITVTAYSHDTDHHCRVVPQAFLRYMDRGRLEAIEAICRQLGYGSWLETYVVNVYKITVRFGAAAYRGEHLTVSSSLHKTSSHRAVFLQRVFNEQGAVSAEAFVELLFLDGQTKQLVPVPEQLPSAALPKMNQGPAVQPIPFNNQDHYKFQLPIRVYYEDTDAQQITYHVSYFNFCERAFTEYISQLVGKEANAWINDHPMRVVRQINRYLNATHLAEQLKVSVGIRLQGERTLILDQRVINEQGTVCTDLLSEIIFVDGNTVLPVPEILRNNCSV